MENLRDGGVDVHSLFMVEKLNSTSHRARFGIGLLAGTYQGYIIYIGIPDFRESIILML